MTPYEYLQEMPETLPSWLDNFKESDSFPRQEFFESRIIYYPGSHRDGQPVKLFGSTHSAHSFVYVDWGMTQKGIINALNHPTRGFRGYHTLARVQLSEHDLTPKGWLPHVNSPYEARFGRVNTGPGIVPFGFLEVLERNMNFDDSHGAPRLSILFLGADGIATYDALFCQQNDTRPPFAVVVQDHGFSGNYDRFGRSGLLERIARRCNAVPQCLLVADNSTPWNCFERVANVEGDPGGMYSNLRFIYRRGESRFAMDEQFDASRPFFDYGIGKASFDE